MESIFCGFWTFGLVFFANETGQRLSDAFDEVENGFGQVSWYSFPKKVQRIFPMLILVGQQSVGIQFFGSAVCGRAQFKKVRNLSQFFTSSI